LVLVPQGSDVIHGPRKKNKQNVGDPFNTYDLDLLFRDSGLDNLNSLLLQLGVTFDKLAHVRNQLVLTLLSINADSVLRMSVLSARAESFMDIAISITACRADSSCVSDSLTRDNATSRSVSNVMPFAGNTSSALEPAAI
jgi:hypothetical protein